MQQRPAAERPDQRFRSILNLGFDVLESHFAVACHSSSLRLGYRIRVARDRARASSWRRDECPTFYSAVLELTHYFREARRSGTVLLLAGEDMKTLLLPWPKNSGR